MLKVLILALMIAPPVWTQPLPEMTELEQILVELETGLMNLNQGLMQVYEGQKDLRASLMESRLEVTNLRMELNELKREPDKLRLLQQDLEDSFSDYKQDIQAAAEAQKVAIQGLKTSRTISFVITGAAVVGLVLVVIFK
jgi:regulator of replication initiation timing